MDKAESEVIENPEIAPDDAIAKDDPKIGGWIAERDQLVASLNETRQSVQQQTILCHRLEGAISILSKVIGE